MIFSSVPLMGRFLLACQLKSDQMIIDFYCRPFNAPVQKKSNLKSTYASVVETRENMCLSMHSFHLEFVSCSKATLQHICIICCKIRWKIG